MWWIWPRFHWAARLLALAFPLLLASFGVRAQTSVQGLSPALPACSAAAQATEHTLGLPDRLLLAIGRAESGRMDSASGQFAPWPWTVNAQGAGHYFASRDEATAFVRGLQAQGVRSIDVGCFQVNLLYHPEAFASLEQAFDPESNAAYAGRFLRSLQARSGAWESAVAFYHSAVPLEGESYRRRVYAALDGAPPSARWSAPFAFVPHADDAVVVLMSAAASRVRVTMPDMTRMAGGAPLPRPEPAPPASHGRRLPRVVTPSVTG